MPKEGTFHFTYTCSRQDRKFALRKSLLHQYGKWKVDVNEDQVTWWAAANEAPEDVLEFLFWMTPGDKKGDFHILGSVLTSDMKLR